LGATGKTGPIDVPGAPLADGSTVMYNNVTVNSSATVAIHDFATARARFGWTYDRLLPYAFVGFAVSRADVTRSADVSGSKTVTPPLPGAPSTGVLSLPRSPQSESKSLIAYGFTAGLGLDVAITPNLFLRGEWEYVQLPNVNDVRVNLNSVHAGLGFKF
jgi:opacity protein-like surface antigen